MLNAENLMLTGGIVVFLLTIYWVRSRDLSETYAVVWTFVAFTLLICGFFPNLIMAFAREAHLAYSSAVLFIALAAIYMFCFSVSVALTQHSRRNIRLAQELAILQNRMERLEQTLNRAQTSENLNTGSLNPSASKFPPISNLSSPEVSS
jgi:hypothetical protein